MPKWLSDGALSRRCPLVDASADGAKFLHPAFTAWPGSRWMLSWELADTRPLTLACKLGSADAAAQHFGVGCRCGMLPLEVKPMQLGANCKVAVELPDARQYAGLGYCRERPLLA